MTVETLLNTFNGYRDRLVCRVIIVVSKNPIVLKRDRLTFASRIPAEYLNKRVIASVQRELINRYIELEVYI